MYQMFNTNQFEIQTNNLIESDRMREFSQKAAEAKQSLMERLQEKRKSVKSEK